MIKYSIIMPLYNKASFVRKALESIVSQTYKDWELIIVDDGSTDNSLQIVNEYIHDVLCVMSDVCEKIKVISQENAGVAAARNNGVKSSAGQFLCFLDADDWWEPTFLQEMDCLIAAYPDVGLYATNYIYYKLGKTRVALDFKTGYLDYPKAYLHSAAMPIWTGAACMPRRVYDEMGGFPVGIKLGEDFLLWAKTALHYKVAYCELPLAYYNNDVSAALRATRNLYEPQYHMVFHLSDIEREVANISNSQIVERWRELLDKLRVSGLFDYWLSNSYRMDAERELAKVDWSKQPKEVACIYMTPILVLKAKRRFMQIGSYCKQKLIKLMTKLK